MSNTKKQTKSNLVRTMGPTANLLQPSKGLDLPQVTSRNKDNGDHSLGLQGNTRQQGITGSTGYKSNQNALKETDSDYHGLSSALFRIAPTTKSGALGTNSSSGMPKDFNRTLSKSGRAAAPGALEASSRTDSQASISNGPTAPVDLTPGKLFAKTKQESNGPMEASVSPKKNAQLASKSQLPYSNTRRINNASSTGSFRKSDSLNSPSTAGASVMGLGLAAAAAHGSMNPDHFAPSAEQLDSTGETEGIREERYDADDSAAPEGYDESGIYIESINGFNPGFDEKEEFEDEEFEGEEFEHEDFDDGQMDGQEIDDEAVRASYYGPGFNQTIRDCDEFSLYRDNSLGALDLNYEDLEEQYYDEEFMDNPNNYEENYEPEEEHEEEREYQEVEPRRRSMPPSSNPRQANDTYEKRITWYGAEVPKKGKKPKTPNVLGLGFGYKEYRKAVLAQIEAQNAGEAAPPSAPSQGFQPRSSGPSANPSMRSYRPDEPIRSQERVRAPPSNANVVNNSRRNSTVSNRSNANINSNMSSYSGNMNHGNNVDPRAMASMAPRKPQGHYLTHNSNFSMKFKVPKFIKKATMDVPANLSRTPLPPASAGRPNIVGRPTVAPSPSSAVAAQATTMPASPALAAPQAASVRAPSVASVRAPPADLSRMPSNTSARAPSVASVRAPPANLSRMPSTASSRVPPANFSRMTSTASDRTLPANLARMPSTASARAPSVASARSPPANLSRMSSTVSTRALPTNLARVPSTASARAPSVASVRAPSVASVRGSPANFARAPSVASSRGVCAVSNYHEQPLEREYKFRDGEFEPRQEDYEFHLDGSETHFHESAPKGMAKRQSSDTGSRLSRNSSRHAEYEAAGAAGVAGVASDYPDYDVEEEGLVEEEELKERLEDENNIGGAARVAAALRAIYSDEDEYEDLDYDASTTLDDSYQTKTDTIISKKYEPVSVMPPKEKSQRVFVTDKATTTSHSGDATSHVSITRRSFVASSTGPRETTEKETSTEGDVQVPLIASTTAALSAATAAVALGASTTADKIWSVLMGDSDDNVDEDFDDEEESGDFYLDGTTSNIRSKSTPTETPGQSYTTAFNTPSTRSVRSLKGRGGLSRDEWDQNSLDGAAGSYTPTARSIRSLKAPESIRSNDEWDNNSMAGVSGLYTPTARSIKSRKAPESIRSSVSEWDNNSLAGVSGLYTPTARSIKSRKAPESIRSNDEWDNNSMAGVSGLYTPTARSIKSRKAPESIRSSVSEWDNNSLAGVSGLYTPTARSVRHRKAPESILSIDEWDNNSMAGVAGLYTPGSRSVKSFKGGVAGMYITPPRSIRTLGDRRSEHDIAAEEVVGRDEALGAISEANAEEDVEDNAKQNVGKQNRKQNKVTKLAVASAAAVTASAAAVTASAAAYTQGLPANKERVLRIKEGDVRHPYAPRVKYRLALDESAIFTPTVPVVRHHLILSEQDMHMPTVPRVRHHLMLTENDIHQPTVPAYRHIFTLSENDVQRPVPALMSHPTMMLSENDVARPDPRNAKHPTIQKHKGDWFFENRIGVADRPVIPMYPIQGKDINMSKLNMPTFNMPTVNMPTFNMPTVNMPTVKAPKLPKMPKMQMKMPKLSGAKMPKIHMPKLGSRKGKATTGVIAAATVGAGVAAEEVTAGLGGARTHIVEAPDAAPLELESEPVELEGVTPELPAVVPLEPLSLDENDTVMSQELVLASPASAMIAPSSAMIAPARLHLEFPERLMIEAPESYMSAPVMVRELQPPIPEGVAIPLVVGLQTYEIKRSAIEPEEFFEPDMSTPIETPYYEAPEPFVDSIVHQEARSLDVVPPMAPEEEEELEILDSNEQYEYVPTIAVATASPEIDGDEEFYDVSEEEFDQGLESEVENVVVPITRIPTPPPVMKFETPEPVPVARMPTPPIAPSQMSAAVAEELDLASDVEATLSGNSEIQQAPNETVAYIKKTLTTQYFYDSHDEDDMEFDEFGFRKSRDISRYIKPRSRRASETLEAIRPNIVTRTRSQSFDGQA
ncbi:hypothetical protein BGX27_003514 [Mortierella sp. AM989]|nr:hypothetical protein BGX27_003514 [Mortierella sp. AM989]